MPDAGVDIVALIMSDDPAVTALADYIYHGWREGPASGDVAIAALLHPGAWGKKPLGARLPKISVSRLEIIYGTRDWMDMRHGNRVAEACAEQRTSAGTCTSGVCTSRGRCGALCALGERRRLCGGPCLCSQATFGRCYALLHRCPTDMKSSSQDLAFLRGAAGRGTVSAADLRRVRVADRCCTLPKLRLREKLVGLCVVVDCYRFRGFGGMLILSHALLPTGDSCSLPSHTSVAGCRGPIGSKRGAGVPEDTLQSQLF